MSQPNIEDCLQAVCSGCDPRDVAVQYLGEAPAHRSLKLVNNAVDLNTTGVFAGKRGAMDPLGRWAQQFRPQARGLSTHLTKALQRAGKVSNALRQSSKPKKSLLGRLFGR